MKPYKIVSDHVSDLIRLLEYLYIHTHCACGRGHGARDNLLSLTMN